MRSILLDVQDDDCLEARLQVALDLCRQYDGHLTCLQAVPYNPGLVADLHHPAAAQLAAGFQEEARRIREKVEAQLAEEDVPWDWVHTNGAASHQLPLHAPLSDLLVVGAHNPSGKADRPSRLASEVVLEVKGPVLVVPQSANDFALDCPAMVAWNGSPESAHALSAAMPMLARASLVEILTVREEDDIDWYDLPPTGAAKYLARHGIEAEIVELLREKGEAIGTVLTKAAHSRKAGYLVMGAYGHSRLRERILGGVTRDMLRDPRIPLFLSH